MVSTGVNLQVQLSEAEKEARSKRFLREKQKQSRVKKREKWEAELEGERRCLEASSLDMAEAEETCQKLEMQLRKHDKYADQARGSRKELDVMRDKIAAIDKRAHSLQVNLLPQLPDQHVGKCFQASPPLSQANTRLFPRATISSFSLFLAEPVERVVEEARGRTESVKHPSRRGSDLRLLQSFLPQ